MTAKKLRLAPDLALPVDFATDGLAVVGMRGSGKSNAQVVWAEGCWDAGVPFVAIDPKGDWYGIRSAGDGKGPGLPVPVFGGLHGDAPLEPARPGDAEQLGARVAGLLVERNLSAVLDVSRLSITTRSFFLAGFFDQLIDLHQRDPHVRSVILEEAHRYIPQDVKAETAKVKEAAAAVLLEGRSWGLGCWACTQRPARLHKDVLEEVGNLLLFGLGVAARNDKNAVRDWFRHHDMGDEIMASLGDLKPGDAWAVLPGQGVARRVRMARRRTFDSGATPTVGVVRRPVAMADVDLPAITAAMAAEIEKARENDPAELKRRCTRLEAKVRELEGQLVGADKAREDLIAETAQAMGERDEALARVVEPTEVPVISDAAIAALRDVGEQTLAAAERLALQHKEFTASVEAAIAATVRAAPDTVPLRQTPAARNAARQADLAARVRAERNAALQLPPPAVQDAAERRALEARRAAAAEEASDVKLGGPGRAILTAMAQAPGSTRERVAFLAGYHPKTKSFTNELGRLRSVGLVDGFDITPAGLAALGPYEPMGRPLDFWLTKAGGHIERQALRILADVWPETMSAEDLAPMIQSVRGGEGYHPKAKSFTNALGRLKGTLGLIEGPRSAMKVIDEVMEV